MLLIILVQVRLWKNAVFSFIIMANSQKLTIVKILKKNSILWSFRMKYIKADKQLNSEIYNLVQQTIKEIQASSSEVTSEVYND